MMDDEACETQLKKKVVRIIVRSYALHLVIIVHGLTILLSVVIPGVR
jgi:hypothetical protein